MIFTRGPSLPTSSSSSPTSLQVHRSSFCGGSYHYTLVVQLPPFIQVIRLQGHSMKKKSIIMIIKSIIRVWVHTLNFDGSVPLSHGWDFLFNWLTLRWDGGDDDLESDKLFNFSYDMMIGTTLVMPKITRNHLNQLSWYFPPVRKGKVTALGLDLEAGQEQKHEQDDENFVREKEEATLKRERKEDSLSDISNTEVRFISELKVGVLGRCKQGFTHSSLSTDI